MSGKNKSKRANQHVYIDRSAVLRDSHRQTNVACGTIAAPCVDREKTGSLERHFKHKLISSEDDPSMLTAMVMHNDICVLVLKSGIEGILSVQFKIEVDSDAISGKKKKGAKKVKAGASVLLLTLSDGTVQEYFTPVGGQIFETNLNLLTHPNLLFEQPCGTGFIAVIYPDTEIPSMTNGLRGRSPTDGPSIEEKKSNLCFSFAKGTCSRGDKCKFKHHLAAIQNNINVTIENTVQNTVHSDNQDEIVTGDVNILENAEESDLPDSKKQRIERNINY